MIPIVFFFFLFFFIHLLLLLLLPSLGPRRIASSILPNPSSFLLIIILSHNLCSHSSTLQYASASSSSSLLEDEKILLQIKSLLQQSSPSFKSSNISDWIDTSSSTDSGNGPCGWSRVTCQNVNTTSASTSPRVTAIDLSFLNISNDISTMSLLGFSNLTYLSNLNLSHNSLQGSISQDISSSISLTSLDLSFNYLTSLYPQSNLSLLSKLEFLHLGSNNISSSVSHAIPMDCTHLKILNLSFNSFFDFSSQPWNTCIGLKTLDLSHNRFNGSLLPPGLSEMPSSLTYLDLSDNQFIGNISASISNLSALEVLNLSENELAGLIPAELGNLTNLKWLLAGSNKLTNVIPWELSKCKNLVLLDLNDNNLYGNLPSFFNEMPSLRYVVLHSNAFQGTIPDSLFDASNLTFIDFSNNTLSGSISSSFSNLSSLAFLLLATNGFSGGIPPELGQLTNLQFLDLSSNYLSGSIPPTIGKLQDLLWLMLANNSLTGEIPTELGNCTSLLWLNLRSNRLTGTLPPGLATMGHDPSRIMKLNRENMNPPEALGECLMMKRWIPENYPPYSFQYANIQDSTRCKSLWIELLVGSYVLSSCQEHPGGYIQLTDNMITGSIPSILQQNRTTILLLGSNMFNGSLPGGLGELPLRYLNVSHNNLQGEIPVALSDDTCLALLDLSYNNFSGSLPESLGNLGQLSKFNVSFNPYLSGHIPSTGQFLTFGIDSYINNPLLCFDVVPGSRINASQLTIPYCLDTPSNDSTNAANMNAPTSTNFTVRYLVIAIIIFAFLLCIGVGFYTMRRYCAMKHAYEAFHTKKSCWSDEDNEAASTSYMFKREASPPTELNQLTYQDIISLTNNFHEDNVLGCGGFGIVYKAELPDGSIVAIKKLSHHGIQGNKEFFTEMETLGTLSQENLVPLLGYCTFRSEKLLIYKYLCNGSLDHWLHVKEAGQEMLKWPMRLRIACNCAKALAYLHHDCFPALIHRDIKASNILLDEEFHGYLADFGLARELNPGTTHVSTAVAGTLGYVPPEYCQFWRATTKGDVYSFGVVMLELITGRQPIITPMNSCINKGQVSDCESCTVVEWVSSLIKEKRVHEAYHDVVKESVERGKELQLLKFVELAIACTVEVSDLRPSIKEASIALESMLLQSDSGT